MRHLAVPLLLATAATLSGCATVGYYAQAVGGHLKVMGTPSTWRKATV